MKGEEDGEKGTWDAGVDGLDGEVQPLLEGQQLFHLGVIGVLVLFMFAFTFLSLHLQ